jgi:hypothetical protein
MTMTRAAAVLALLAIAGCLPRGAFVPTPEQERFEGVDGAYTVELPRGWMRVNDDETVAITRDGPTLQNMVIARRELSKPLRGSKRVLSASMEPYELAELISGELASSEKATGVKILENAPADVGGARGFKLVVAYKDADGLRMKSVQYGAATGEWLWAVAYSAPSRLYFDRDLRTFEKMVASFRFAKER